MWYGLRMSSKANADFASAMTDLLQSTLRALILATSGICLAWYLVGALVDWPMASLGSTFLVALVVIVVAAVALYVLPKRLLAAQVWWLVGVGGVVVLAAYLFRRPEIAFLFALLPLMAVVTVGWPAGLLAQGFVVVGVWWLSSTLLQGSLSFSYGLGIVAGGAVAGTLGWSVTQSLLRVTGWALSNYEQGWHSVREMREQQLEFRQTQEDLVHANRELARLSDRLKAMQQVAEEARRAKEEFVANVSHELRTPLNIGSVLSNVLVAYGFSRIYWRGRDVLFSICLMTMMIPGQVTMVPVFIIFKHLGWVNSYRPLVVPAFFANAYTIFMLRQFFRTIPRELSEAALIDGAGEFTIMWRIIMPLVKPALAVVALSAFMGAWNDYMGPLIYINQTHLYPLAMGLARLSAALNQPGIKGMVYPYMMAVSTIVTLPSVLIFFFAQRTFIEGIVLTGIKG